MMDHKKDNYNVGHFDSSQRHSTKPISVLPPAPAYSQISSVIRTGPSDRNDTGILINAGSSQLYGSNDVGVHQGTKMTSLPLVHLGSYQLSEPPTFVTVDLLDPGPATTKKPYIFVSIIAGLLCCLPLGVCATYNAWKAKTAAERRDEEETEMFTSRATTLIVWTVFTGLCIILIFVLFVIRPIDI